MNRKGSLNLIVLEENDRCESRGSIIMSQLQRKRVGGGLIWANIFATPNNKAQLSSNFMGADDVALCYITGRRYSFLNDRCSFSEGCAAARLACWPLVLGLLLRFMQRRTCACLGVGCETWHGDVAMFQQHPTWSNMSRRLVGYASGNIKRCNEGTATPGHPHRTPDHFGPTDAGLRGSGCGPG